mmetsp:Transcript_105718/g.340986  ORF Transcript_105718/g.340986 Transcript_105718/m.340986 type:complete len:236 (-) Transcript_105718:396-1103(-)
MGRQVATRIRPAPSIAALPTANVGSPVSPVARGEPRAAVRPAGVRVVEGLVETQTAARAGQCGGPGLPCQGLAARPLARVVVGLEPQAAAGVHGLEAANAAVSLPAARERLARGRSVLPVSVGAARLEAAPMYGAIGQQQRALAVRPTAEVRLPAVQSLANTHHARGAAGCGARGAGGGLSPVRLRSFGGLRGPAAPVPRRQLAAEEPSEARRVGGAQARSDGRCRLRHGCTGPP